MRSIPAALSVLVLLAATALAAGVTPATGEYPASEQSVSDTLLSAYGEVSFVVDDNDHTAFTLPDSDVQLWIPGGWWEVLVTTQGQTFSVPVPLAQYLGADRWERASDLKGAGHLEIVQAGFIDENTIQVKLSGCDDGRYYVELDGGDGPGWAGYVDYHVDVAAALSIDLASGEARASAREVADDPLLYDYDIDEIPCPWRNDRDFAVRRSAARVCSEYIIDEEASLYPL